MDRDKWALTSSANYKLLLWTAFPKHSTTREQDNARVTSENCMLCKSGRLLGLECLRLHALQCLINEISSWTTWKTAIFNFNDTNNSKFVLVCRLFLSEDIAREMKTRKLSLFLLLHLRCNLHNRAFGFLTTIPTHFFTSYVWHFSANPTENRPKDVLITCYASVLPTDSVTTEIFLITAKKIITNTTENFAEFVSRTKRDHKIQGWLFCAFRILGGAFFRINLSLNTSNTDRNSLMTLSRRKNVVGASRLDNIRRRKRSEWIGGWDETMEGWRLKLRAEIIGWLQ